MPVTAAISIEEGFPSVHYVLARTTGFGIVRQAVCPADKQLQPPFCSRAGAVEFVFLEVVDCDRYAVLANSSIH